MIVYAYSEECDLTLRVSPDVDFDSTFNAQCMDTGEHLRINGWLFRFEIIEG